MIRTLNLTALMILFPFTAMAEEAPPESGLQFDHVALSVMDETRSAAFYGEVLGLEEITNKSAVEGIRWFSLGQQRELHLISVEPEPVTVNKAVHLALTTSDFDGFVATLRRSGIDFSNWPGEPGKVSRRADGVRQLYLQDPDGYWIEINSTASD